MAFEDIPGFDKEDRKVKSDMNKVAIAKFVVNDEINEISMQLHRYRDYLEQIPYPKQVKKEVKVSLKKQESKAHSDKNEHILDM